MHWLTFLFCVDWQAVRKIWICLVLHEKLTWHSRCWLWHEGMNWLVCDSFCCGWRSSCRDDSCWWQWDSCRQSCWWKRLLLWRWPLVTVVNQVWPLTQFFLFPLAKKILICMEGKSMTPNQENTSLFSSSQQVPPLRLVRCFGNYRVTRTPSGVLR